LVAEQDSEPVDPILEVLIAEKVTFFGGEAEPSPFTSGDLSFFGWPETFGETALRPICQWPCNDPDRMDDVTLCRGNWSYFVVV
jgi:hypothetical protein